MTLTYLEFALIVFSVLFVWRSFSAMARMIRKIDVLVLAVKRAEHGFNRIRSAASSGQVVDKEVEKQARGYADEMKKTVDLI